MALGVVSWDVRTTGSANNGGGFVVGSSGTDWTQQDSPQYALTGIASSGAGNTVLSALAAADMVGNIAQVISGTNFNTGFFQVASVSVGVSITFSTNNASQSICSGVGAAGVINIGGGFALITTAQTQTQNNDSIHIKAGTYTLTTGLTFPVSNLSYIGYQTIHNDGGTKPLLTTATNSINIFTDTASGPTGYVLDNLSLSSTAGTPGNGVDASNRVIKGLIVRNCKFSGFAHGIIGDNGVGFFIQGLQLFNTEITACTVAAIQVQLVNAYACYIHDNTGDGWVSSGTSSPGSGGNSYFSRCIFSGNVHGAKLTAASQTFVFFENCVFYGNSSDGLDVSGTLDIAYLALANNIFYGNTGFGLNMESGSSTLGPGINFNNAYGSNTAGARSNSVLAGNGAVALSANPFNNAGSGDFSLNSTAGGGAACSGAGFQL